MNRLNTHSLACAAIAVLVIACGKPGETTFLNVGPLAGSGGASDGGSGGTSGGSGGAGDGGSATLPDAGTAADSGAGGSQVLVDAGPDAAFARDAATDEGDAAIDAGTVAAPPTFAEICASYCQSKQDFIGGTGAGTCSTLDNSGCVGECLGAIGGTPPPCDAAYGTLFACYASAASYECTAGSPDAVDAQGGVCIAEQIAIGDCFASLGG